ncbi:MAG: hypothetical protein ABJL44_14405 [Algibacter sp.]
MIAGASDTGKSYVFSIIEFMFGREESPKPIPESKGYVGVYMEILTHKNVPYTLGRKFHDNIIYVKKCSYNDYYKSNEEVRNLGIRHSSKSTNNISSFLLSLCGYEKHFLKFDRNNKKVSLSFADIRKISCIQEEKIITEESPFYFSGDYTKRTKDQSYLNFLLTGKDANNLIEKESEELTKAKIKSKLELLKDQQERKTEEYKEVYNKWESVALYESKDEMESLNLKLLNTNKETENLADRRKELFVKLEEKTREFEYNLELSKKFGLLKEHYNSDLKRLEFVVEGNELMSQLNDQICPVCFQEIEENHVHNIKNDQDLFDSIVAEHNKIVTKNRDLENTLKELRIKENLLREEITDCKKNYESVDKLITEQLKPQMDFISTKLQAIVDLESVKLKKKLLEEELDEILERKAELLEDLNRSSNNSNTTVVSKSYLLKLAKVISFRLKAWNYIKHELIDFDSHYKVFDIVIGDKHRKSFGKGKRGVSFSACVLGIMDYCYVNNRPFSNLLVLDSPLTAYESNKRNKDNNKLERGIVDSFYKNLSEIEGNRQVIVFDNKIPDESVIPKIKYIEFDGIEGSENFGFFPVN